MAQTLESEGMEFHSEPHYLLVVYLWIFIIFKPNFFTCKM